MSATTDMAQETWVVREWVRIDSETIYQDITRLALIEISQEG